MPAPVLVWFRRDLRLADHAALAAASDAPVLPVFILESDPADRWPPGGAARWWLHHSLEQLAEALHRLGVPLVLRRGEPGAVLAALAAEIGADAVLWNRRDEPAEVARDAAVAASLRDRGLRVETFASALLHDPARLTTKSGGPFKVFTPFWRTLASACEPAAPLPAPQRLAPPAVIPASDRLADWGLLPTRPDWAGGLRETWTPGEAGARARLAHFLEGAVADYPTGRDRPDRDGTTRLSPHLTFGEITPRQVWHAARHAAHAHPGSAAGVESVLREVGWREFAAHLLHHNPAMPDRALDDRFAAFPWAPDRRALRAWQRGLTGYPIVDAGMRQLWRTGWMHNRVRMIAASFLIKDLLQPWQAGEAWFWDTLVDADLASNAMNWQWVAGCGADAAPFFRVFNPVLQGRKFDPDGAYVREFVPELADIPTPWIHEPWAAPGDWLTGTGYPRPIVDHGDARQRALDAFATVRSA